MADCVFCSIASKEIPAFVVWEDENLLAFLDTQPVNPGHLLIIPKMHIESVFDMPDDIYKQTFEVVRALSTPLQKAMQAIKIGIAVEGFGVAHAHVHLVPLNGPGELDPKRATPMENDALAIVAEKIKNEISKNSNYNK